jgi:hypothetical protein
MPEKKTVERARRALRSGKKPTTAAGEFVREEIEHVRGGKHGARSAKQAIAIGLSKARRSGVPVGAPSKGTTSARTRRKAQRDLEVGEGKRTPRSPSPRRSRAVKGVLKRERTAAASRRALSKQAKSASRKPKATGRRTATGKRTATGRTSGRSRTSTRRSTARR